MLGDALGLVELGSLARGYRALDALSKRSPVTVLEANLVEQNRGVAVVVRHPARAVQALGDRDQGGAGAFFRVRHGSALLVAGLLRLAAAAGLVLKAPGEVLQARA